MSLFEQHKPMNRPNQLNHLKSKAISQGSKKWQAFGAKCEACRACDLYLGRDNIVVFRGSCHAPLLILGEGPGAEEDKQGMPFVGRSGHLLDLLLQSYGFKNDYHICNIVKCRPPGNRAPKPQEALTCKTLLLEQISLVKPRVILLLGGTAYHYFTEDKTGITKVRGLWQRQQNYWVLPTFHPAYILRNNSKRGELWEDIGKVREKLIELDLIQDRGENFVMPEGRK